MPVFRINIDRPRPEANRYQLLWTEWRLCINMSHYCVLNTTKVDARYNRFKKYLH